MAPYRPDHLAEEDDDLMDESQGKGFRVLGVAYAPSRFVFLFFLTYMSVQMHFGYQYDGGISPFRDTPVFCALINGEGEVVDFLRLPYFMKRRNAFREEEREKKVQNQPRQGFPGHYSELIGLQSVFVICRL